MIKQVPYGISDFNRLRRDNLYYVDKTMYLPLLENEASYLFFIRPRRFGKSIFISMLHAYYDIGLKDKFDEMFGDLWIARHPTPLRNRFLVLHLDFSQVGGTIEQLEENFNSYCNVKLDGFISDYRQYYTADFVDRVLGAKKATDKLNLINDESRRRDLSTYLIIDEYDNFTNTVLNEQGEEDYWAMMHAEGFYRDIFKKFKGTFERIFITGVSPVTLDDVTSGFNIGWHISTKEEFNQMLGFSAEDVREMFTYYKDKGLIRPDADIEDIIEDMKPWYDNYCFAEEALDTQSRVFNCDMVLYYLRNYVKRGQGPKEMIDPNTKTDYNKMRKLIQLDKLDGDRKGVIRIIAETGQIVAKLEETFPAHKITDPLIFPSLLFYYGMLTIQGTYGTQLILGIPNNNVRKQYYGYLLEEYQEAKFVNLAELEYKFTGMAFDGHWREPLEMMAAAYADVSSVRDAIEGERNLQGFYMAYLSLNGYYYVAPELELSHGYCDFFLLPDLTHYPTKHSYILELKLAPKKEKGETEAAHAARVQKQWDDAVGQIYRYAAAPRVEALRQGTTLHKIIVQFDGYHLLRMEEV